LRTDLPGRPASVRRSPTGTPWPGFYLGRLSASTSVDAPRAACMWRRWGTERRPAASDHCEASALMVCRVWAGIVVLAIMAVPIAGCGGLPPGTRSAVPPNSGQPAGTLVPT
jgi:hypothetical protein